MGLIGRFAKDLSAPFRHGITRDDHALADFRRYASRFVKRHPRYEFRWAFAATKPAVFGFIGNDQRKIVAVGSH